MLLQGALGLRVINKAPFAMMGALFVALIRPVMGERRTAAELNSSAKLTSKGKFHLFLRTQARLQLFSWLQKTVLLKKIHFLVYL